MDTSSKYRFMCLKADHIQNQWNPQVGDFMISKASYCCDEDVNCSKDSPCEDCLRMCNVWVVSGRYDYHDSVGGTHWFFGGHACNKDGGNKANSTACSIMTNSGHSEIGNKFNTSSKSGFIWLPRQDQLQEMMDDFDNSIDKLDKFNKWLFYYKNTYNVEDASMEQLWLRYFMDDTFHEVWYGSEEIGWDVDGDLFISHF